MFHYDVVFRQGKVVDFRRINAVEPEFVAETHHTRGIPEEITT